MRVIHLVMMIALFVIITNAGCKNKPEGDITNPFFSQFYTTSNVPPFEKIMAKHYMPAFEKEMDKERKGLEKILNISEEPTFQNAIHPLDSLGLREKVSLIRLLLIRSVKISWLLRE
jgi:peptidyl-dipeptidase Dcp